LNKTPRFFCDNCGYEVDHEVKACPYCGRYFAAVRCPSCDFSGPEKMFLNGCPLCGYSANPALNKAFKTTKKRKNKHSKGEFLPAWTYILLAIIIILFVGLFSWYITQ
jgi:uncharacterized membrane protein YvbJ